MHKSSQRASQQRATPDSVRGSVSASHMHKKALTHRHSSASLAPTDRKSQTTAYDSDDDDDDDDDDDAYSESSLEDSVAHTDRSVKQPSAGRSENGHGQGPGMNGHSQRHHGLEPIRDHHPRESRSHDRGEYSMMRRVKTLESTNGMLHQNISNLMAMVESLSSRIDIMSNQISNMNINILSSNQYNHKTNTHSENTTNNTSNPTTTATTTGSNRMPMSLSSPPNLLQNTTGSELSLSASMLSAHGNNNNNNNHQALVNRSHYQHENGPKSPFDQNSDYVDYIDPDDVKKAFRPLVREQDLKDHAQRHLKKVTMPVEGLKISELVDPHLFTKLEKIQWALVTGMVPYALWTKMSLPMLDGDFYYIASVAESREWTWPTLIGTIIREIGPVNRARILTLGPTSFLADLSGHETPVEIVEQLRSMIFKVCNFWEDQVLLRETARSILMQALPWATSRIARDCTPYENDVRRWMQEVVLLIRRIAENNNAPLPPRWSTAHPPPAGGPLVRENAHNAAPTTSTPHRSRSQTLPHSPHSPPPPTTPGHTTPMITDNHNHYHPRHQQLYHPQRPSSAHMPTSPHATAHLHPQQSMPYSRPSPRSPLTQSAFDTLSDADSSSTLSIF